MIKIIFHRGFIKEFPKLPKIVQEKAVRLEEIFKDDCFNRRLRTKKLQGKIKTAYSFRVTRDYRITFRFISNEEVEFLSADNRKDIYK